MAKSFQNDTKNKTTDLETSENIKQDKYQVEIFGIWHYKYHI